MGNTCEVLLKPYCLKKAQANELTLFVNRNKGYSVIKRCSMCASILQVLSHASPAQGMQTSRSPIATHRQTTQAVHPPCRLTKRVGANGPQRPCFWCLVQSFPCLLEFTTARQRKEKLLQKTSRYRK